MASDDFGRKDLEEAFRIDPRFGMDVLYKYFQPEIAGYIKYVGHGALDEHDIADIFSEVLLDMIVATDKSTFDPTDPMRLVYRIAYTNTKEFLKKRGIRSAANLDDCLDFLAEDLQKSDLYLKWKYLSSEEQLAFNHALFDIINTLPEMQRITAIVFVTRYKDIRDRKVFATVAEGIREFSGKDITTAAAKRNWHEARKKIADELLKRGYKFFQSE